MKRLKIKWIGHFTVKYLLFAWPYFREAITLDLIHEASLSLFAISSSVILIKNIMNDWRWLYFCVSMLSRIFAKNKVVANKKSVTVHVILVFKMWFMNFFLHLRWKLSIEVIVMAVRKWMGWSRKQFSVLFTLQENQKCFTSCRK